MYSEMKKLKDAMEDLEFAHKKDVEFFGAILDAVRDAWNTGLLDRDPALKARVAKLLEVSVRRKAV